jgi:hypothetical protein
MELKDMTFNVKNKRRKSSINNKKSNYGKVCRSY